MSKIIILILVSVLLLFANTFFDNQKIDVFSQSKEKTGVGEVKIVVSSFSLFDREDNNINDDEYVASFRVYLKGKNFFEEMPYKKNGEFQLDVPEGVYSIILKSKDENP